MAQNNPNLKWTRLAAAVALGLCTGLATIAYSPSAAAQTAETKRYDLKAGTLDEALSQFGLQSGLQILAPPELVAGHRAQAVSGDLTSTQVLERLLRGTGLSYERINANTIVIKHADAPAAQPQAATRRAPVNAQSPAAEVQELEKMTVTGTRIRGVAPASPLLTITQEEMRLSGHHSLGDVIRAIPQNFAGGQNPGVQLGGGGANLNVTSGSALDLRGLGADATLSLLNGTRLPYDGFNQATDVAVIPVAAIDRFEVLLDGASAIYGSDAVGGVANIILKRDYDGADLTARYGQATDGGYEQTQVSTVVGTTWASGSLLVAGETTSTGNVLASQRKYLSHIQRPDLAMIHPKISQDGVLVSAYQMLGSRTELALDAFYTKREAERASVVSTATSNTSDDSVSVFGVSPSLRIALPGDWSARIHGFAGEDEAKLLQRNFSLATGAQTASSGGIYRNQTQVIGVELEGKMFSLPGGQARASFGGGWRRIEYENSNAVTGVTTITGANTSRNLYGEIHLPVIGRDQGIPYVDSLSFNGALRHEDYDQFGSATTPRIGAVWQVGPTLDIKASWGKSFKAPRIREQYQQQQAGLYPAAMYGIAGVPANATVLFTFGGNPDLDPEHAEVVTAGLVFRPAALPGATVELGMFDIDFRERIVQPFGAIGAAAQFGTVMDDPSYTPFIIRNPSPSEQQAAIDSADAFTNQAGAPYDPANVVAIVEHRWFNASRQRVRGIDLDARYTVPALDGLLSFNLAGSWIIRGQRQNLAHTDPFDTAGVAFFPSRAKGRFGARWMRSNFTAGATLNYQGGVLDTRFSPSRDGGSMTTLDLTFDVAADPDRFNGFGLAVNVANVFNRSPPYLRPGLPFYVNYDSTNYSALGRVMSLSLTKKF